MNYKRYYESLKNAPEPEEIINPVAIDYKGLIAYADSKGVLNHAIYQMMIRAGLLLPERLLLYRCRPKTDGYLFGYPDADRGPAELLSYSIFSVSMISVRILSPRVVLTEPDTPLAEAYLDGSFF